MELGRISYENSKRIYWILNLHFLLLHYSWKVYTIYEFRATKSEYFKFTRQYNLIFFPFWEYGTFVVLLNTIRRNSGAKWLANVSCSANFYSRWENMEISFIYAPPPPFDFTISLYFRWSIHLWYNGPCLSEGHISNSVNLVTM